MRLCSEKARRLIGQGTRIAPVILIAGIGAACPDFRTADNIFLLLRQLSADGLVAFGMTFVIAAGGIDLSVGTVQCLSAMLCAGMIRAGCPVPAAVIAAAAAGIPAGLLNGMIIVKGKLRPFVGTLISVTAYRGVGMIFSGGRPVSGSVQSALPDLPGEGALCRIPAEVWILAAFFAAAVFIFHKTVLGRHICAVGCGGRAAALCGVSVGKVRLAVYAVSGLCAAASGAILAPQCGNAPPDAGIGCALDAIAAAALGGTGMSGGRGTIPGALFGAAVITMLNNGLEILGAPAYCQQIVKAIIFFAVLSARRK